jgi:hypothetical protein
VQFRRALLRLPVRPAKDDQQRDGANGPDGDEAPEKGGVPDGLMVAPRAAQHYAHYGNAEEHDGAQENDRPAKLVVPSPVPYISTRHFVVSSLRFLKPPRFLLL